MGRSPPYRFRGRLRVSLAARQPRLRQEARKHPCQVTNSLAQGPRRRLARWRWPGPGTSRSSARNPRLVAPEAQDNRAPGTICAPPLGSPALGRGAAPAHAPPDPCHPLVSFGSASPALLLAPLLALWLALWLALCLRSPSGPPSQPSQVSSRAGRRLRQIRTRRLGCRSCSQLHHRRRRRPQTTRKGGPVRRRSLPQPARHRLLSPRRTHLADGQANRSRCRRRRTRRTRLAGGRTLHPCPTHRGCRPSRLRCRRRTGSRRRCRVALPTTTPRPCPWIPRPSWPWRRCWMNDQQRVGSSSAPLTGWA